MGVRMMQKIVGTVLTALVLAMSGLATANAQDPLKVAPETYKKLTENNQIRVLEAQFKPGAKTAMHSHPERLFYLLTPGTLVIDREGKTPYEMNFKAGEALVLPAQTLATENNGDKTVRALIVELKADTKKRTRRPQRSRRGKKKR